MSDGDRPIELVERFLRSKRDDIGPIDPDLDLIESRVLDSVRFIDFLYFLEEQTGREIALEDVTPEDFRTVNAIVSRFFDDVAA